MKIKELTEENTRVYRDLIPPELLCDIKREYCRGLVGEDERSGAMTAAVFWELKNSEDTDIATTAEILWFYAAGAKDGTDMLNALEEEAEYDEVSRFFFEFPKLSEAEREALSQAGYSVGSSESRDICVTVEELASLKLTKKRVPDYIQPISEITARQFKAGIMTSVFHGKYGILEDLPYLPMSRFDPDISCCIQTDDKVTGLMLIHESEEGPFRVELLFAQQPDANINLLYMICHAIRTASEMLTPGDMVLLRRHNKATAQLIKKLFPDKKGVPALRGEKKISV